MTQNGEMCAVGTSTCLSCSTTLYEYDLVQLQQVEVCGLCEGIAEQHLPRHCFQLKLLSCGCVLAHDQGMVFLEFFVIGLFSVLGKAQFPFGSGAVGCRLRHGTRVRLSRVIGTGLRRDPEVHASECLEGGSSHCGAGNKRRNSLSMTC